MGVSLPDEERPGEGRVHLEVDLSRGEGPVEGSLMGPLGTRAFAGWLELWAAMEEQRAGSAAADGPLR